MKTVEDFKNAGLVFVDEDIIKVSENLTVNYGHAKFDSSAIVEGFAWRKNTGEKPSFKGVAEIHIQYQIPRLSMPKFKKEVWHAVDVNWTDEDIKSWRPHLPQVQTETPEEKEAFDKMSSVISLEQQSGFIPKEKEISNAINEYSKIITFIDNCNFKLDSESYKDCIIRELSEKHDIDMRSEKEKFIEQFKKDSISYHGVSANCTKWESYLYNVGYRKC